MVWNRIKRLRRHLSREQGTVVKEWGGRLPIALVYPNSYYLGMSNLGLHTIYRLLNNHGQVVAERVFWEKGDDEALSLESRRPLSDFSVIAFSITYELDYFNVVSMLRGSNIPLYSRERDERHPLVIGGGGGIIANPMPLSPFFDCLGIGDAEKLVPAMLPLLAGASSRPRHEVLEGLAALPGIYVPSVPARAPVARQWVDDLDEFPVGTVVYSPDTELGDLCLVEVQRGCTWGCRFCLVGGAFHPRRFRSLDSLIDQAKEGMKYRSRIGLVGPVVTDHPRIEELLVRLRGLGAGLSISSLRVKPLSRTVLKELAAGGARTVTLAPEAGSERLRRVINKGITEDDILESVAGVAEQGFRELKLYFMLGLPREEEEDVMEIIRLVGKCKALLDRHRSGVRLSLNIAPFVPKAGTPFQWLPYAGHRLVSRRLSILKKHLPPMGVRLKYESPAWSEVQAVLARGDSALAGVLAATEVVSLAGWRRAVEKCHLDIDYYTHQTWDINARLPWAVLDMGLAPNVLRQGMAAALSL